MYSQYQMPRTYYTYPLYDHHNQNQQHQQSQQSQHHHHQQQQHQQQRQQQLLKQQQQLIEQQLLEQQLQQSAAAAAAAAAVALNYESRPAERLQENGESSSPSSSSSRRASRGKSKRIRTIFTPEQLKRLEEEFSNQMYLVGHDRCLLASSLNLSEAQVKVWFQNRRIKFRKQTLPCRNELDIDQL